MTVCLGEKGEDEHKWKTGKWKEREKGMDGD